MSRAAKLTEVAAVRSDRLLADVADFGGRRGDSRLSILDRLAQALGRDEAERIVGMLSKEAAEQIDRALTSAFARRLTTLAEKHDNRAA
jgi:hypothetical protein